MNFFDFSSNCFGIQIKRRIEKLLRGHLKSNHFIPFFPPGCGSQFLTKFLIWNKCRLRILIITKITQMNQISEDIILAGKIDHIILKTGNINFNRRSGKHSDNSSFQSVKIHIDERNYRIVRTSAGPVTLIFVPTKDFNNSFGIINLTVLQQIAIIPPFDLFKIPMILGTKCFHFFFCKTNIFRKTACVQHRKLIKIIQCRLCLHFFYRKNTGQISKRNISGGQRSFKKAA